MLKNFPKSQTLVYHVVAARIKLAPRVKNNSFELSTTPERLAIPGFSESTIFYPIKMSSPAAAVPGSKFPEFSHTDKALFEVAVARLSDHLDTSPEGVAEESDYEEWGKKSLKYLVRRDIFCFRQYTDIAVRFRNPFLWRQIAAVSR